VGARWIHRRNRGGGRALAVPPPGRHLTPTEKMAIDARQARELTAAIVGRAPKPASCDQDRRWRDLTIILEACTEIRVSDAEVPGNFGAVGMLTHQPSKRACVLRIRTY